MPHVNVVKRKNATKTASVSNYNIIIMITVEARLNLSKEDEVTLKSLMRKYSSCMRFAYKQLCNGVEPDRKLLRVQFDINSRYADYSSIEAKGLYSAQKEMKQDPKKVIFGSNKLFKKLQRRHLTGNRKEQVKQLYQETRNYNLWSVAQKSAKGNRNTQIQGNKLRINVGFYKWIYAEIKTKHRKWNQLLASDKYTVKITIRNKIVRAYFTFSEVLPEETINFDNGAIGIDLNASPANIAWA